MTADLESTVSEDSVQMALLSAYSAAQAALISKLRSIDAAEDAMQDAALKAYKHWARAGIPSQPVAWLIVCATNAFRDQYRKDARYISTEDPESKAEQNFPFQWSEAEIVDAGSDEDVLRLIFMCSHPGIAPENQLALSLKMLMGFSMSEIAKALLVSTKTLEKRITRAKRKIANSGISLDLPRNDLLPLRLDSVRRILYLIFNEGYLSEGAALLNRELCRQSIRLCRALCRSFPEPENFGLLSLMLFHDARAPARIDEKGELVTLDTQNRMLWKCSQIEEADVLLQKALRRGEIGTYQLQAAIAGIHSLAISPAQTDWPQIVGLYRRLYQEQPSAVIGLNFAVALMMVHELVDAQRILSALEEELCDYSPYYAAVARLSSIEGRQEDEAAALTRAAHITGSEREKRHYHQRLLEMDGGTNR